MSEEGIKRRLGEAEKKLNEFIERLETIDSLNSFEQDWDFGTPMYEAMDEIRSIEFGTSKEEREEFGSDIRRLRGIYEIAQERYRKIERKYGRSVA